MDHGTDKTPLSIVYSVEAKLSGHQLVPLIDDDKKNNITNRTKQIDQLVQQHLNSNAIKMKIYYNYHLKHHVAQ